MPRYEIVAHVTRERECESAEEAAAIFRQQLQSAAQPADCLVHLAVWREDAPPATSPLAPGARQKLMDFFATLELCAQEAEEAFRGRVEAILMRPAAGRHRQGGRDIP